jgi:hypothetical protein
MQASLYNIEELQAESNRGGGEGIGGIEKIKIRGEGGCIRSEQIEGVGEGVENIG